MNKRILGFDLARALAVIGMVIVNFEIVMGAEANGPHWVLSISQVFHGRAAALFVVLAGCGLSLLSNKARRTNDVEALAQKRTSLLKRAAFLFVVGLLYTPIWPADILHFYGLYITIGALLLGATDRHLWSATALFVFGFVAMLLALDYERGWDFATLTYLDFWTPEGFVRHLFFNGFHPVFPWTAFLLFGMWLGRLNVREAQVRRRMLWIGGLVAIVAESLSRLLIRTLTTGTSPDEAELITVFFDTAPMPPMPLYLLAGAGTATFVLAICIGVAERYPKAVWLQPMVSTGQLALTLYVAHVVIGMGTLEAIGRLENQSPPFAMASALVFSAAAIAFATLWRRRFARGPLEWVMRRMTQ